METTRIIELQSKAVTCFARSITGAWDYLVVDFEVDFVDGQRRQSTVAIAFVKKGDSWVRNSFISSFACREVLFELGEAMASDGKPSWKRCTFEAASNGQYRFSFSYDPPRRLSGVSNEETRMETYVPRPL